MKTPSKTTKLISALLLISLLTSSILFARPQRAEAIITGWVSDFFAPSTATGAVAGGVGSTTEAAFSIKDFAKEIIRQVLMTVANRFLQEMTKSTINWINSGFHGNPLFLPNPESFFKDIAKYEIRTIIDTFGYDTTRYPFGRDWALGVISSFKTRAETNAEYTLSRVLNDPILLRNYRNDFNVGGWDGFLINTQYPQNNYIGWNMMQTEALARELDGTVQNKAQKVQTALEQGMGFLSPKKCVTNPGYNSMRNEFQEPRFDPEKEYPSNPPPMPPEPDRNSIENEEEYLAAMEEWNNAMTKWSEDVKKYEFQRATQIETLIKPSWKLKNTCPPRADGSSGFEVTTPGSVVGDQIKNAMGSQFRKTELAASLGNSISAITDALINHFLDQGLGALASKVNPKPPADDWSYLGQTLGSPADGVNTAWDAGPDEVVILGDFKTLVEDGIKNTQVEITLLDNPSSTNPGITQLLGQIWPKTRELDICIPGPDLNWEDRSREELERNASKLVEKSGDDDPEEAARAKLTYRELKFAVDFFQDWINNKMLTELPNSVTYLDVVDELDDLSQQSDELTDKRRSRNQALARLKAIQIALANFTSQPTPGSAEERVLVSLKKQYNATNLAIANTFSIEDSKNELAIAKEKVVKLNTLIGQCKEERKAKDWNNPGGRNSTWKSGGGEQQIFCDAPIAGGYEHGSFRHRIGTSVTHPEVPLVNAQKVFKYDKAFGSGYVNIEMKCNLIFNASPLDYKGNLPGTTTVSNDYNPFGDLTPPPDEEEEEQTESEDGDLSCSPSSQTVRVGQTAGFAASGGNGSYVWSQNDASPSSGTGPSWSTSWSSPSDSGGKVVIVSSGNQSAQCGVLIVE